MLRAFWLLQLFLEERGLVIPFLDDTPRPRSKSFPGSFGPFRRFGLAIWDDQSVIDLGFMTSRGHYYKDRHFYCFRWRSVVTESEISQH